MGKVNGKTIENGHGLIADIIYVSLSTRLPFAGLMDLHKSSIKKSFARCAIAIRRREISLEGNALNRNSNKFYERPARFV